MAHREAEKRPPIRENDDVSTMGPSELKQLLRALEEKGFEVEMTKGNHRQVRRDGQVIANLPGPTGGSDYRGWANALCQLKRCGGFEWRRKQPRRREPAQV